MDQFAFILPFELSQKLELQQKRSLAIILGSRYKSYNHATSLLELPRLDSLCEKASLKWAFKAQANRQNSHLFPPTISKLDTRHKRKFVEYFCHTTKYYNSAVLYITRQLNLPSEKTTLTTNSGLVIVLQIVSPVIISVTLF